jgi:hypothetical protein
LRNKHVASQFFAFLLYNYCHEYPSHTTLSLLEKVEIVSTDFSGEIAIYPAALAHRQSCLTETVQQEMAAMGFLATLLS